EPERADVRRRPELRRREFETSLSKGEIKVDRVVRILRFRWSGTSQADSRAWVESRLLGARGEHRRRDPGTVGDVKVEVDADPFEEAVGQSNEADLDRDLQVLQAAELFEQIGNLLVDPLRLAD